MIKIYTSPSCSSCRKVKKWFEEQNIPYEEKNIFSSVLNENDLKEILNKSENGTDDIISGRSKIMKDKNIDINDMKISELITFIKENPSILKRPIMVDDRRIQVGYNEVFTLGQAAWAGGKYISKKKTKKHRQQIDIDFLKKLQKKKKKKREIMIKYRRKRM